MRNKINRVVLIGTGAVGCSYVYSMINQGVSEEIVLIDVNVDKAEGEMMDLIHGIAFAPTPTKVRVGTYADCSDADIVVITAGLPQKPGETRLELVYKNSSIIQRITRQVILTDFSGIFLIASNPVDVMTHVVYETSKLPARQVIGSGTTLDSARLRVMMGAYLGIDPRNIHGVIMGEHGDSELAVWSQMSVGIETLDTLLARRGDVNDKKELQKIFENTRDAAYHIINKKGATFYGIGMSLTRITKAILNDENSILPVSVLMEGQYGQRDLHISTPCIINRGGIKEVIEVKLNDEEMDQFTRSAEVLKDMLKNTYK